MASRLQIVISRNRAFNDGVVLINKLSGRFLAVDEKGQLFATTSPKSPWHVLWLRPKPNEEGTVHIQHLKSHARLFARTKADGPSGFGISERYGYEDQDWTIRYQQVQDGEPAVAVLLNSASGRRLYAQTAENGGGLGATTGWGGHPDQSFYIFKVDECKTCDNGIGYRRPRQLLFKPCSCRVPAPFCCGKCVIFGDCIFCSERFKILKSLGLTAPSPEYIT